MGIGGRWEAATYSVVQYMPTFKLYVICMILDNYTLHSLEITLVPPSLSMLVK